MQVGMMAASPSHSHELGDTRPADRVAELGSLGRYTRSRKSKTMKLLHQRNIVFVGARNGRVAVQWTGVAIGFAVFAVAIAAASLFGWYLLALMTGAEFSHSLAACVSISIGGAAAVVTTVVTSSLRRPVSDLPSLD